MMNDKIHITIEIDIVTLKMIEEGATLERDNLALNHKDHPEYAYRMVNPDQFVKSAISEKYSSVKKENIILTA